MYFLEMGKAISSERIRGDRAHRRVEHGVADVGAEVRLVPGGDVVVKGPGRRQRRRVQHVVLRGLQRRVRHKEQREQVDEEEDDHQHIAEHAKGDVFDLAHY